MVVVRVAVILYTYTHMCYRTRLNDFWQTGLNVQGVVAGIGGGRGYVDVSTVDAATSKRIADAITYAH